MGAASGATGSNNWRSFPNNFIYSGILVSSASGRGESGYYWTSTVRGVNGIFHLTFVSYSVSPGTGSGGRYNGTSVRCVQKQ